MRKRLFAGLIILSLMFGGYLPATAQQDGASMIGVIVHTAKPYAGVIAGIEALGGEVTIQYANADAVAASVPADRFADLLALKGVDQVEKDLIVQLPPTPEGGLAPTVFDPAGNGMELLDAAGVAERFGDLPENYFSYLSDVTGAQDTWAETGFGADSIIAVIDTGTDASHVCLSGRVIAGPDFSPDVGTPFEGSTLVTNHYHGTFVGGVAATGNGCALVDVLGGLFETHLPPEAKIDLGGGFFLIPLLGIAPEAQIYAVKTFPHTGAGVPTSIINQALDHVISEKLDGFDIDVVNMSLGGASLYDGHTLNEMLVDAATDAGMVVVAAAGNEGPAPGSVARPGTAFSALTAGAVADPVHSRIFWDAVFGPGQGLAMYPTDEFRVADFSSRGPLGDGRAGPDLSAAGVANFSLFPGQGLGWASGTSFATPTIAGGAALLNAWAENNDPSIGPRALRNALMDGAVPFGDWSPLAQGHGYLNVANSLALVMSGKVNNGLRHDSVGQLKPTVLRGNQSTVSQTVTLAPGETYDWVFEISENTESVVIDIDVDGGPIPPGPGALANSFEFYVKSAKGGGQDYIIDTLNVFDDATATIGDGFTTLAGGFSAVPDVPPNNWPMEPGLMKVTLEADWTNSAPELTATVTITRTEGPKGNNAGGVTSTISGDEAQVFVFEIPPGTTLATFDLSWSHDYSKFPTNDLDLLFASPSSFPFIDFDFLDAATLNAPERQVITDPEPGTWFLVVDGFTVHNGRDPYQLDVTLEN